MSQKTLNFLGQVTRMSEEVSNSPTNSDILPRANKPAGLRSPSILGMQAAGWLVLASMWLPVNRGCGGTIRRPIEQLNVSLPVTVSEVTGYLWFLASYGNGLLVAMLLSLSAFWCSERLWWRSFIAQGYCTVALCVTTLVLILRPFDDAKEITQRLLTVGPPMVLSICWIRGAIIHGQRQAAWARLQHCWTLVAFIMLNLQCIFSTELLYGYWLSIVGFALLTFFIEFARYRMQHDLWDRSLPAARPQFSVRSLFFWTTFCALTIGYFSAIEHLIDWLFPSTP